MMKAPHNTRVIVGMSGGVDSSVSAYLLKQQGYQVEGVFMQNWTVENDDPYCTATQDLLDARAVCDRLHIPLQTVNFAKEYWDRVFQYFLDEYAAGRTPNPDIMCNKEIKFKAFLDYALSRGADLIATGHYARVQPINDHYQLLKGLDDNKDQSYFLYTLGQQQLKYCLFPVGELHKAQVRAIATEIGLINHAKKDSTGICFIGERKFKTFLQEYLLCKPGNIETPEQQIIGKHDGLMYYTLGQRKGLGIGGKKDSIEAPWYVIKKDISRNTLIVAQQHDHPWIMSTGLICADVNWTTEVPTFPLTCQAKTRYRQADQACVITKIDADHYQVNFTDAQWAVTPGQSVVFYDKEICLGGGIIQQANNITNNNAYECPKSSNYV